MFLNKQTGNYNKDVFFNDYDKTLKDYLEVTKDFKSSFDDFIIKEVNGFNVIDESESNPVGAKARMGEFLVKNLPNKELVYVQPRRGFAGISLSYLCKKYNKNLTLIMPSSKEPSPHQTLCIEYGAKPIFVRIAAMPNANRIAKIYAEQTGAAFIPLGLQHPDVIAGAVTCFHDLFKNIDKPKTMWSVISTGVLTRSLQIALPETDFNCVAVARNIQNGELGRGKFYSYHKPFNSTSDLVPDKFNCEPSYDSKGWDYMNRYGNKGDWFFSVAGEAPSPTLSSKSIDSYRDWNDFKDLKALNIVI